MDISLNGSDWKLRYYNPGEARGGQPFSPDHNIDWWMDATVPGVVQSDLIRAGRIPDPYVDMNAQQIEWVPARDWVYARKFDVPATVKGRKVRLHFEGIDYSADIYLNGRHLGHSENAFIPAEFDITPPYPPLSKGGIRGGDVTGILNYEDENRVVVILDPAPREYSQIGWTSKVRTYKTRMSYGWDFAVRLIPLGIWDDVKLIVTGDAYIADSWAHTELSEDLKSANLFMQTKVQADKRRAVTVQTRILFDGIEVASQSTEVNASGLTEITQPFSIDSPKLWWPNGHGDPNLYSAEVVILSGREELDRRTFDFGFKRVRLLPNPGIPEDLLPWNFEVNGKRIYLKGWNWVPADSMYGTVSQSRYERLIGLAKDANVNLLRVWGGGLIEKAAFYDLCDRLGIMVWQEFILSSSGLDNDPPTDPEYLNMIRHAAEKIIPRRRNHACHAIWCGGNELTWKGGDDAAMRTMREAAEMLDPQKVYIATSPMRTFEEGEPKCIDIHGDWQYHGCERHYEICNAREAAFHSEFGAEGAANLETIRDIIKDVELMPISREKEIWRLRGEWWVNTHVLEGIFGPLADIENFVAMSQFIQWEGLRYAVEQNRRRKYASGGTIPWQFNEPWPNLTCTNAVDYYLRPKPAYYAVKSAYEPVHVSASYCKLGWKPGEEFRAELWANNSGPAQGCTLRWSLLGVDGAVLKSGEKALDLSENSASKVDEVVRLVEAKGIVVLEARLVGPDGADLSRNSYVFSSHPEPVFAPMLSVPKTTLAVEQGQGIPIGDAKLRIPVTVRNTGESLAFFVKLSADGCRDALYSRNYLILAPGDSETIYVTCTPGPGIPRFTAHAWNAG